MKRVLFAAFFLFACHPSREARRNALSDPDPIKRMAAVEEIAKLGEPEEVVYLVGRVGDPDPFVRAAVAEGLGRFDDRRAVDAAGQLVSDDNEGVALKAVDALGHMKPSRSKGPLLVAYQHGSSKVRAQVAESLKLLGLSPGEAVEAEARARYQEYSRELSGSGASRLGAAEQLGRSGRPEVVERLTGYLGAESHALAIAAARGLGASGAPGARPPLEALLTEDDPDLQVAGAQALGVLGDPAAGDALVRSVHRDGTVAAAAMKSLLALPLSATETTRLLCGLALSSSAEAAGEAGRALRERGLSCSVAQFASRIAQAKGDVTSDVAGPLAGISEIWQVQAADSKPAPPELERPIEKLLRAEAFRVRAAAARVATSLGYKGLLQPLVEARKDAQSQIERARQRWVKDPLPRVFASGFGAASEDGQAKHAEIEKLVGLTTKESEEGAVPSLFSQTPGAAATLWTEATLGEIRFGASPVERLTALGMDPLPRARRGVVEACGWLADLDCWKAVQPLLADTDEGVREAAVVAVGRLHSPEAAQWLLTEVKSVSAADPDVPIDALIAALGRHSELPGVMDALDHQLREPGGSSAAIAALVAIGDAPSKAKLLAALREPRAIPLDPLLAAEVKLKDPAALELARPLLFHVQPEVRADAARLLFALEGDKALGEVQALQQDYDRHVRETVVRGPMTVAQ